MALRMLVLPCARTAANVHDVGATTLCANYLVEAVRRGRGHGSGGLIHTKELIIVRQCRVTFRSICMLARKS